MAITSLLHKKNAFNIQYTRSFMPVYFIKNVKDTGINHRSVKQSVFCIRTTKGIQYA